MKIALEKASGRTKCRGQCKNNPEFISVDSRGRRIIIKGTTCAAISMNSSAGYTTSYFCRDCIDKLYIDMKTILNPKLWSLL